MFWLVGIFFPCIVRFLSTLREKISFVSGFLFCFKESSRNMILSSITLVLESFCSRVSTQLSWGPSNVLIPPTHVFVIISHLKIFHCLVPCFICTDVYFNGRSSLPNIYVPLVSLIFHCLTSSFRELYSFNYRDFLFKVIYLVLFISVYGVFL